MALRSNLPRSKHKQTCRIFFCYFACRGSLIPTGLATQIRITKSAQGLVQLQLCLQDNSKTYFTPHEGTSWPEHCFVRFFTHIQDSFAQDRILINCVWSGYPLEIEWFLVFFHEHDLQIVAKRFLLNCKFKK